MRTPETTGDNDVVSTDGVELSRAALLQQMERLIASKHFRNSKRYPSLLKFVVEQTLAGNTEGLKERTLGISVFNKPHDYDTNADPIVRVTAGEIRKRIAQYYQEPEHEHELRIDLPLGSYVPHFLAAAHALPMVPLSQNEEDNRATVLPSPEPPVPVQPEAGKKIRRPRTVILLLMLLTVGAAALLSLGLLRERGESQAIGVVWKPIFSSKSPALIVMGVHTLDSSGHDIPPDVNASATHDQQQSMLAAMIRSEMIPVSDLISYSKITDLLTQHSRSYGTKASTETTLDELRQGPVILIGALDNVWTMRFTSKLRYSFFTKTNAADGIQDAQHPSTTWTFDNTQRALGNTRDYAIVASYFDPGIEQHVFIAAGVGKTGTQAASEFLTSEKYLKSWLAASKLPPDRNVELVLSTEILDGRSGPPTVLASYSW